MLRVGGGASIEMASEADFRSQVEQGVLQHSSRVTVYRGDDPAVLQRAREVPELKLLLDEAHGSEPETRLPVSPLAAPVIEDVVSLPGNDQTLSPLAFKGETLASPDTPTTLVLDGWRSWFSPQLADGSFGRYFAVADVNVRVAPSKAARRIGHLRRGQEVAGEIGPLCSAGRRWLAVKNREGDGGYVLCVGLSPFPPVLLHGGAGRSRLVADTPAYSRPSAQLGSLLLLGKGRLVRTEGFTSDGWTEIALPDGSVGYVVLPTN